MFTAMPVIRILILPSTGLIAHSNWKQVQEEKDALVDDFVTVCLSFLFFPMLV